MIFFPFFCKVFEYSHNITYSTSNWENTSLLLLLLGKSYFFHLNNFFMPTYFPSPSFTPFPTPFPSTPSQSTLLRSPFRKRQVSHRFTHSMAHQDEAGLCSSPYIKTWPGNPAWGAVYQIPAKCQERSFSHW